MTSIAPSLIRFEEVVPPGSNWSHVLKRGTTLRITDTDGGANVSALFYNFELPVERLNLPDTLKCQHIARLTAGNCLYSDMGRILVSITADTCGWHDPLGGVSNEGIVTEKYGALDYQTARNDWHRDAHNNFLRELGKYGMGERDLAMNVNFFQKVTVDEAGRMTYHAGQLRARRVRRSALGDEHPGRAQHLPASPGSRAGLPAAAGASHGMDLGPARPRRSLPDFAPRERPRLHPHRTLCPLNGLTESPLDPARAVYDSPCPPGTLGCARSRRGQIFRIVDLEGNQAVDTLFYNAHDPADRYSAQDTIREQAQLYLTTGTRLMSTRGDVLLTIVADTCGRHDTLGGACACESNTVRYALEKRHMHACRDRFMRGVQQWRSGLEQARHRPQHQFLHERAR